MVIVDVGTGDGAAWQLLDALGRDPATARIPVLVCAAPGPDVQDREAGLHDRGIVSLQVV